MSDSTNADRSPRSPDPVRPTLRCMGWLPGIDPDRHAIHAVSAGGNLPRLGGARELRHGRPRRTRFLLGSLLARAALLATVNANAPSPRVISLVVKMLIAILSFAMALEQLQIAKNIVVAAFVITFGAEMLCLSIAFGVGGKVVARRVLEPQLKQGEHEDGNDDISHI